MHACFSGHAGGFPAAAAMVHAVCMGSYSYKRLGDLAMYIYIYRSIYIAKNV